jgi:hypothetical protein
MCQLANMKMAQCENEAWAFTPGKPLEAHASWLRPLNSSNG